MTPRAHNENSRVGTFDREGQQQQQQQEHQQQEHQQLECDYLVIGAGTSGMSFVDTILTENPEATLIVVDRNSGPGGHWVHVYPFCSLHQTSCNYGVNSMTLGKNINKKGNERYDIDDRSTGQEVVEYYQKVQKKFEATGRVRFFFGAEYSNKLDEQQRKGVVHAIRTNNRDGDNILEVTCHRKLVTIESNVVVPSMRKPTIPVHEGASFLPVNALPESIESDKFQNYIVFGCGKTGADAIVYLLRQGVDQSRIKWIVSRDYWFFVRETMRHIYKANDDFMDPMVNCNSTEDIFLEWEKRGVVGRIDTPEGTTPEVCKGGTMDREEIGLMRTVENVVRMGRASAVEKNTIVLDRGTIDYNPETTLLVDCMVGNSYGSQYPEDFSIYEPGRIKLGPMIFVFNPSSSAASIAFLECALDNDDAKNDCCYFMRDNVGQLDSMLGSFYLQTKTIEKLMKVPGGAKFFSGSRTNILSPVHHKGGMLRLLWYLYGPEKGAKKSKMLTKKVESNGYIDLDHCFGAETPGTICKAF